jgi:phosphopantothenoylcysteine decarboxylase/phosphopantothenate--cysteine ligase
MLRDKKIVLGVTGSIAAYKSAMLVRLLVKAGAEVKVVMTPSARDFITPLTLATLSKNPVLSEFVDGDQGEWNNHVELGLWADVLLIAPASASTLSKMANGHCDNLLIATYLSAKCPVFFAPAMDLDMYLHGSTKDNIDKLLSFGNQMIEPTHGELASGLVGQGRMAEPEEIISLLEDHFSASLPLKGKRVLVTAGPTFEAIDPVRFIGNHSSGKMGFALAEELAAQGADVVLVSGPTHLQTTNSKINRISITSAQELYEACVREFPACHIGILAAAVADYRPANPAAQKIKKGSDVPIITLEPTPDTLQELGKMKTSSQMLVGFALETENELENAKGKIARKNLDLIVLNSLNDAGAGFGTDTNRIAIIDRSNKIINFELKSKASVAKDIVRTILNHK